MRTKLRKYLHCEITVRGTINSIGVHKKDKSKKCLLLNNIVHHVYNEYLCDHIWIEVLDNMFKYEELFKRGDIIQFNCKVKDFLKKDCVLDYGLFNVSKVRIVGHDHKMIGEILLER